MDELTLNMSLALSELQRLIVNHETSQLLSQADIIEERNNEEIGFSALFVGLAGFGTHPDDIENDLRLAGMLSVGKHHQFHGLDKEAQWAQLGRIFALEKLGVRGAEILKKMYPNRNKRGKKKDACDKLSFRRQVVLSVFQKNDFFADYTKEAIFHLFWDKNIRLDEAFEAAKATVMDWADLYDKSTNRDIIAFGKKVSRDTTQHEGAASLFIDHFS